MRLLLFLTATIDPGSTKYVERDKPQVRMKDYAEALENWIKVTESLDLDIVFCENSGYSVKKIMNIVDNLHSDVNFTLLQFESNDYPPQLGKGFGEAGEFDHLIENFSIQGYDYIVKMTGRLFVRNFLPIVNNWDGSSEIYCQLSADLSKIDSRFVSAPPDVFESYFVGLGAEVDDSKGVYLEHVLAKRVLHAIADGHSRGQFYEPPYFIGVSGSTDSSYNGIQRRARFTVKKLLYRYLRIRAGAYI